MIGLLILVGIALAVMVAYVVRKMFTCDKDDLVTWFVFLLILAMIGFLYYIAVSEAFK